MRTLLVIVREFEGKQDRSGGEEGLRTIHFNWRSTPFMVGTFFKPKKEKEDSQLGFRKATRCHEKVTDSEEVLGSREEGPGHHSPPKGGRREGQGREKEGRVQGWSRHYRLAYRPDS